MEFKIAGALAYLSTLSFVAMWFILLFVGQPDCIEPLEAAKKTAIFVLTEPNAEFFYLSLLSILVSFTCGTLLFTKTYAFQSMVAIMCHTLAAIFIYDWSLVLVVALPLLWFNKINENT